MLPVVIAARQDQPFLGPDDLGADVKAAGDQALELAEREGIAVTYMTRVLRLDLLAPNIVEAILDGQQGPDVTLARLLEPFPALWQQHLDHFR